MIYNEFYFEAIEYAIIFGATWTMEAIRASLAQEAGAYGGYIPLKVTKILFSMLPPYLSLKLC
jgi:hypothetical protein